MEVNRLPGLESSKNNFHGENALFNNMMLLLLQLVTQDCLPVALSTKQQQQQQECDDWYFVHSVDESVVFGEASLLWKNSLKWKTFTYQQRQQLLVAPPTTVTTSVNNC